MFDKSSNLRAFIDFYWLLVYNYHEYERNRSHTYYQKSSR